MGRRHQTENCLFFARVSPELAMVLIQGWCMFAIRNPLNQTGTLRDVLQCVE